MDGCWSGSRPSTPYSSGPNVPDRSGTVGSWRVEGALGARATQAATPAADSARRVTSPPMLQPTRTDGRGRRPAAAHTSAT